MEVRCEAGDGARLESHGSRFESRLLFYSLKKRVDGASSQPKSTFVELPSMPLASECVIEFEDGSGASMRMHLKGTDPPDVLALSRSFWNAD